MPSYDKEKLMRMMQERHVGFLAARDLQDRQRDLRKDIARIAQNMRISAASTGQADVVEHLLQLPLDQARALTREQVEKTRYVVPTPSGGVEREAHTGIDGQTWGDYLQYRSRMERLETELQRNQTLMNDRYAILPKLKDAVVDWGFKNPDHEM